MAVKTKFAAATLTDVLSNYDLGQLKAFEGITEGSVQTNYLLQTTQGKFVFRYYENRAHGSVTFETDLIRYLTSRGYPCSAVYETKQGRCVGTIRGKPYALFEFIEGAHLENPTESQKNQLIEKVAELHILTREYHSPYQEHRWNYSIDLCRELAREAVARINTANARKKLAWYEDELATLDLPETLPRGICHCDFHFSNILFKDGEFRALIDFDDANYTYLTYDLATLINPFVPEFDWATWGQFQRDATVFDFADARKTVAHYSRHRRLGDDERRHLFDVYKLTIMVDCIWYFKRGNADNFYERRKIERLNQLGRDQFHKEIIHGI